MIQTLIKNWWLLTLRGVLAAVFSVMAFLMLSSAESLTLRDFATKGIVVFLGILAIAAGVCTIAAGVWKCNKNHAWLLVLDGLAIGAAGLIFMLSNSISFRLVIDLLVILAIVSGVIELAAARSLRRHVSDEWFLGLAGAASIGFAIAFLVIKPEEAASCLIWLGSYSAFSAICLFGLSLRLRGLRVSIHRMAAKSS